MINLTTFGELQEGSGIQSVTFLNILKTLRPGRGLGTAGGRESSVDWL